MRRGPEGNPQAPHLAVSSVTASNATPPLPRSEQKVARTEGSGCCGKRHKGVFYWAKLLRSRERGVHSGRFKNSVSVEP
jgi:hypothetical protein